MIDPTLAQLIAVVTGGLIAIAGGILTTTVLERQKQQRESRNLALAFKGEIAALIELINERRYQERFAQIIQQIEQTGTPFYMPFRLRFKYDRVYEGNVNRIGLLKPPLPEQIPLFYARLTSILEDMVSLGDGTYANVDLDILLRIYRDSNTLLALSVAQGKQIIQTISTEYRLV